MSQAFISKVEAGLIDLTGESLSKVADALNCPVDLLTDDTPIQGLEVTCLHHRRHHSKINAITKRRIEALTHLTRVTVEGFLGDIELVPEVQLVRLSIEEHGSPADIAQIVRTMWRVPSGPIENVMGLVEAAGVIVVTRDLGSQAQAATTTWPHDQDRPPILVLNAGIEPDRQRYTLAHELGHLIMHPLPSEDQEKEADEFAAVFLAPAEDIEDQLVGLTTRDFPRLLELKAQWGMSVAALIRRARDLDQISDRQYREFNIKLSKLGWRTREPGTLVVERPRSLARVIEVHRVDHGYSEGNLATVALMNTSALHHHYGGPKAPPSTSLRLVRE